jgi:hypothetical protein
MSPGNVFYFLEEELQRVRRISRTHHTQDFGAWWVMAAAIAIEVADIIIALAYSVIDACEANWTDSSPAT